MQMQSGNADKRPCVAQGKSDKPQANWKNNLLQIEPSDYEVYIVQENKLSLEGLKDQTEAMKGMLFASQYFS